MTRQYAKIVRVATAPPIMASAMVLILRDIFPGVSAFRAVFFLGILPVLSYPICWAVPGLRKRGRAVERMMAVVFCVAGYIGGSLYCLLGEGTAEQLIVYLTYLISGVLIALFSYGFKVKGSGHASGVAGPVAMLVYRSGPWYLLGAAVLAAVFWSSLKLGRHTWTQLLLGSAFPVAALVLLVQIL